MRTRGHQPASRAHAWSLALPQLARDAELSLRVSGACMLPLIAPRQRVRVRAARRYWPGDVLAVVDETGGIKLHRCIGYVRRAGTLCVLTQPDASDHVDAPTPLARVLGRVRGGECDPRAVVIPWSTRLRAVRAFVAHVARALGRGFA